MPKVITITMDQNTVDKLQANDFLLYGFKAVQGPGSGKPLVWFQTGGYSLTTTISWFEEYQAYTSTTTNISSGTHIVASATYSIHLGEVLNVIGEGGTGEVTSPGPDPHGVAIDNQTMREFTCGLSQQQNDGAFQPMCAFPLLGETMDVIVPVEKVLLIFATEPVNVGTVIERALSQGALVDLTTTSQQTVEYRVNQGWTRTPGVEVIPADSDIVSMLILPG